MDRKPVLVWFRRDLRLGDHPPLAEAAASGRPVIPVYIHDPQAAGAWAEGGAGRWWLHGALTALARDLERLGVPLILRRGPAAHILAELAAATGAELAVWSRGSEPWMARQDVAVTERLRGMGLETRIHAAGLLFEPERILTGGGRPFKVFTPFWKACLAAPRPGTPLSTPAAPIPCAAPLASEHPDDWGLRPTRPDWAEGLRRSWQPGEVAARDRLAHFLDHDLDGYDRQRDLPARDGTSRLSPHLHFGEISVRQVFHAAMARPPSEGRERFLAELGWREFSAHLLHWAPSLPEHPLRPEFRRMDWRPDASALHAWQRGRTGYPLVDAGMRQLWATGWMHNRVRMVAASFLVKDLLIPWQDGQSWFWDTLVDADLASNAASWQWVAGCGTDAAPFFRIFNPVRQAESFDPDGAYIRRWCPELSRLPDAWIHQPWKAPAEVLRHAGLSLDHDYPRPMIDHDQARRRALEAFSQLKQ